MAKKMIILILAMIVLSINVNAEVLAPAQNVPLLISLDKHSVNNRWNPITFAGDDLGVVLANSDYPMPTIAIWQSRMMAGEFYKINIDLSPDNDYRPNFGTTGFLEKSDDMCVYLVDATKLLGNLDLSVEKYRTRQWGISIGLDETDRVPDDSYQMFYDTSSKLLSVLLMSENNMTDYYVVVKMGRWTSDMTQRGQIIYRYAVNQVEGAYTDILADIKEILQESSSGGGGLTEEQVNEAIQEALNAHDQALEEDAGTLLDDILEQIDGIVSPYSDAADQINTAFDGLSDVFASTSTASVLTFPAGRMPNGVLLWPAHAIDIGAAWLRIPAKLRAVVQIVCTFTILYAAVREAIFVIRFIILGRRTTEDD